MPSCAVHAAQLNNPASLFSLQVLTTVDVSDKEAQKLSLRARGGMPVMGQTKRWATCTHRESAPRERAGTPLLLICVSERGQRCGSINVSDYSKIITIDLPGTGILAFIFEYRYR